LIISNTPACADVGAVRNAKKTNETTVRGIIAPYKDLPLNFLKRAVLFVSRDKILKIKITVVQWSGNVVRARNRGYRYKQFVST
jgi:hypothetical protein